MIADKKHVVIQASFGAASSAGTVVLQRDEVIQMLKTMEGMKRKLQNLLKT
jgi:hypothetical protein